MRTWRATAAVGTMLAASAAGAPAAHAAAPHVLMVCPTGANDHPVSGGPQLTCPAGQYSSIQAAVDAAAPGDWILVAPGDYHEQGTAHQGVYITTPNIHLRGMSRNSVIVDGTSVGARKPCSPAAADQNLNGGNGRDGIVVFKTDGTRIDNLTVCNYLGGAASQGNEIWWNGGDGTGIVGMGSYRGTYITGTTTYFTPANNASYGIFVSNSDGPGSITNAYASNMSDSGFYVGACNDCNAVLNHVHSENNALGYSGTNAGGHLLIENSEWDLNRAGIVPNSLNNDDAPPPQTGLCPGTTAMSCTRITRNNVHDNNNPNVPGVGIASAAPIGAGIELSGGSWDTVDHNTVDHQNGWGIVTHDYPDTETPPPSGISHCQGGVSAPGVCTFQAQGDVISNNSLASNGGFGNPSNGDLANESSVSNPRNCFSGNRDPGAGGPTSDPAAIETVDGPPCGTPGGGDSTVLAAELVCASGSIASCPPGINGYPQSTGVTLLPLHRQPSMPNPCAGVPDSAWCINGTLVGATTNAGGWPLVALFPAALAMGVTVLRRRSAQPRRVRRPA